MQQDDLYETANEINRLYDNVMESIRALASVCDIKHNDMLEFIASADDLLSDMYGYKWRKLEQQGLDLFNDRDIGKKPTCKEVAELETAMQNQLSASDTFAEFLKDLAGVKNG